MSLSPRTFSNVATLPDPTDAQHAPLVVVPWSMFGARRLYVDTADGRHVGWVDLNTGHRSLVMADLAPAFEAAVDEAEGARAPRRALAQAIEFALIAGLSLQDEPEAEPEATVAADTLAEDPSADMRRAYRGKQAYSDWDLSPCGKRLAADEHDRTASLDPRWAYQNSTSAGRFAEVAHLFA